MKRRSFIREIILLSSAPAIVHAGGFPLQFLPVIKGRPTASGPAVYLQDDFNRADSITSLGAADVGGAWTAANGTWGIESNQGRLITAGGGNGIAQLDASHADATAQVTLNVIGNLTGLLFRYTDTSNYWWLLEFGSAYYLQKVVGGSTTNLISGAGTAANGDVIKVILSGNSIKCYNNGVQLGTDQSDSFNASATKFGMVSNLDTPRFDTFLVTA